MQTIVSAILSIFSLIIIGFVLKHKFYRVQKFWDILDSLTYYILMPSLLIYKIAVAKIDGSSAMMSGFLVVLIAFFIISLLSVLSNFIFKFSPSKFTSVFQGAIRYNTYIFLAIVGALYGEEGFVIAAFLMAFMIPLINIFCVCIFAIYVRKGKFSLRLTIKNIFKNPLVLACIIGICANLINLPSVIFEPFKLIGSAAVTTGLLSVGAGLKFGAIKNLKNDLFVSSFLKLALYPFLVYIGVTALNLPDFIAMVCIFFAAMPTATSSYILAGQLGGDKELMAVIITLETLLSMITIWAIYIFAR